MIYLINLLIFIIYGGILSLLESKKYRRIVMIISSIHISLFHALRNPFLYSDTEGYSDAFELIRESSFLDVLKFSNLDIYPANSWEKGYVAFNWLLGQVSPSSSILFIVSSFIIVGLLMWIINKWSYSPFISVLVFLLYPTMFFQSLFVLRQHMAMAITWLALYNVENNKRFFLISILAICFHTSAIIVLPFFVFYNIFNKWQSPYKLLVLGFPIAIVGRGLIGVIMSFIPRFSAYSDMENNIVPILMLGLVLLGHLVLGSYRRLNETSDRIILSYLLYGFLLSVLIVGIPGGGRLSNYATNILILAIPLILKLRSFLHTNRIFKIIYVAILIACILIFDYVNINLSGGLVDYELLKI